MKSRHSGEIVKFFIPANCAASRRQTHVMDSICVTNVSPITTMVAIFLHTGMRAFKIRSDRKFECQYTILKTSMFGNFFMKMMLQRQLKNLPKDVQDKMMRAIEQNPDFFKRILDEIQTKVKSGQSQGAAIQQVMMAHRAELQKLLGQ